MVTMLGEQNLGYALGASDYLTKPIERERLAAVLRKYYPQSEAAQMAHLLLVEDDEPTREMMRRMLQKEGWEVTEAENGRKALDRLADMVHLPNLILLDLMMPEMDGFQFIAELHQKPAWEAIPIVVVTAMELTPAERQQLNGAVEQILQKGSYSREELLRQVRDQVIALCGQPSAASTLTRLT
jgi:CheY-like chemotaxis protein